MAMHHDPTDPHRPGGPEGNRRKHRMEVKDRTWPRHWTGLFWKRANHSLRVIAWRQPA